MLKLSDRVPCTKEDFSILSDYTTTHQLMRVLKLEHKLADSKSDTNLWTIPGTLSAVYLSRASEIIAEVKAKWLKKEQERKNKSAREVQVHAHKVFICFQPYRL